MKLTRWNGLCRLVGAQLRFTHALSSNFQAPRLSASRPCRDQPVVSLAVYKAQRRRAVLAAQANARCRTVISLALCLLGLVACVAVQERDVQVQPAYGVIAP